MDNTPQKISLRIKKRLLFASVGFWFPVVIFLKFADDVFAKEPILIDEPLIAATRTISSNGIDVFMKFVTHGGDTLFIFTATLVLSLFLYSRRRRRDLLAVLFSVGGAGIINVILKLFFQRDRPSLATALISENSFSFPSGHAMGTVALGLTLVTMLWRSKWRWLSVALATVYISTIGFSRVYLGVHYPSDVVGGWCVSAVWVFIVYVALEHPGFIKRSLKKILNIKA